MESVYISGRGIVSPLGRGLAENEAGLRSGKSGLVRVPEFISNHLDSEVGGMVGDISAGDLIDRKKLRFCPPTSVMHSGDSRVLNVPQQHCNGSYDAHIPYSGA